MKHFKQGDIIMMDFSPTRGHEQRGRRPALVVSVDDAPKFLGLHVVCPITNNMKPFPTHIELDSRTATTGVVLCEHLRSVDLEHRNPEKKDECPDDILQEVLDCIQSLF